MDAHDPVAVAQAVGHSGRHTGQAEPLQRPREQGVAETPSTS
jgi:hypothetical protein